MTERTEEELYEQARRRVADIVGLFIHAAIYLAVNAGLWTIDLVQGGGLDWAYWTTIPWGIGLAIHGVVFFLEVKVFTEEWKQRRIEDYVARRR